MKSAHKNPISSTCNQKYYSVDDKTDIIGVKDLFHKKVNKLILFGFLVVFRETSF